MKKIVFLTGTRADFGKLKSLMSISQNSKDFEVHLFVTGMHMNPLYGSTVDEITKAGFKKIYKYINHDSQNHMDRNLAKTIDGFSQYIEHVKPDLIVVHGDRVEALAGAIVGSLNNILVAHIEGGEVSGTIDELIRHSVSKMSHIHLVANNEAKNRLIQLGEFKNSIFVLGSPDLDLMNERNLPDLSTCKSYYDILFDNFAIAMFHPITTEYNNIKTYAKNFVDALIRSNTDYIVIFPNNDLGSKEILEELERLKQNERIRIFPSLRFEYFLRFLKESQFIIGNSSAGIRECAFLGVKAVNIGNRQEGRDRGTNVIDVDYDRIKIKEAILESISSVRPEQNYLYGEGNSGKKIADILATTKLPYSKIIQY